jgi:hypothetical protein
VRMSLVYTLPLVPLPCLSTFRLQTSNSAQESELDGPSAKAVGLLKQADVTL